MNYTIEKFFKEPQVENFLTQLDNLSSESSYIKYLYKVLTTFKDSRTIPENLLPNDIKALISAEQVERSTTLQQLIFKLENPKKAIVTIAKNYSNKCSKQERAFFGGIMLLFTNFNEVNISEYILQQNCYVLCLRVESLTQSS
jgi:hypothetical protein